MKIIKNDWRSRLGESSLNDLMWVTLESPDIQDFKPDEAIDFWLSKGKRKRRPEDKPVASEKKDQEDLSEDEEEQVGGMEDDQLSDEDVNIDEEDVDMIESARSFLASMKLGMPHVTGCDDDLFFCK